MSADAVRMVSADTVRALGFPAAVAALERAVADGLDPEQGWARQVLDASAGQLLLMPAEAARSSGIKVATVVPGNPERGLSRIQATYLLLDRETLSLRAVLDGTALTELRTPAVSVLAVRCALDRADGPVEVVVFGAGPQALGHVEAFRACAPDRTGRVSHVVRRPEAAGAVGAGDTLLGADDPRVAGLLRTAGLVVCATGARTPLFDSVLLDPQVVVVAMGSHEPDAREVDSALVARAQVLVESRSSALRECGDVVLAIAEGAYDPARLITLAEAVRGPWTPGPGPVLFKGSGMPWQDLVVAEAVLAT